LLGAGHSVAVYNRSAAPAEALAGEGARVADHPRAAVEGADLVLSFLTDDAASEAVWLKGAHPARAGLRPGVAILESSTVTVGWTQELAGQLASTGAEFGDAPVVGSRPQAEAGQLVFLVGGSEGLVARLSPLEVCGTLRHVGPVGAGATLKLGVNALFAQQVAGLSEILGALEKAGLERSVAVEHLSTMAVTSPALKGIAALIAKGAFAPLFPVDLVEKDLGYALRLGGDAPMTEAARGVFQKAQARGWGDLNINGVARLYLE
ncbi:MAG: NAD(P)-dependent oxidoreductase, partial [Myxococcota bacterium]